MQDAVQDVVLASLAKEPSHGYQLLKLVAAAAARLADPVALVDAQRRELLRQLRDAQACRVGRAGRLRLCAAAGRSPRRSVARIFRAEAA